MNNLFRAAFIIAGKDLYSEWKTKQVVSTMLIFSGLVIVTFSFAFDPSNNAVRAIIPGLIWVITIFAAILGLNRSFLSETKNDNLYGMIVSPTDPSSIYLGKVLANFVFVLLVQLISIPVLFLLFDFRFVGNLALFVGVVFLGTFGFISVGTFLAGLAANSRSSEMLLPILLFPIVSPLIIAAVQATRILLIDIEQLSSAISWMQLMGVYNLLFFVLCLILFEYVLEV
ncbi:transcriptional regulator [Anaerobacillus alkalidiazotrophicus]|uniref:Heme exporter protein B n=1 Tax=Anaerobacillus alkalidiazotrophicus TaxID=472963 RepID=A0A1S2M6R4_9BACI|nr:heme exporter protein CcmB [Anaerobacillus alkalidiazotrophicus]OIJ20401.1 transcriptional regulator [Anaerobacillus alkalidiazotrophicus]